MLNTEITAYEIAMVHVATKMARLQESRTVDNHYVDAMNYLAFAAQFAPIHEEPRITQTTVYTVGSGGGSGRPTIKDDPSGMVEADIAEIAKRFAPINTDGQA